MGCDAQVYGCRAGIDNNRVCVRVLVKFCHQHATSNHPIVHMYNDKEEPRTLTYQDANSLYSWAMSQVLPLRGFKLVPNEIDILNVPEDSKPDIYLKWIWSTPRSCMISTIYIL